MRRSCLPAREGLRFGWQNPKEWRGDRIDSRTLILGRGAAASARSNPRDQEKERYLAHSNAKTARWSLAGIFPEKMSSPQVWIPVTERVLPTFIEHLNAHLQQ